MRFYVAATPLGLLPPPLRHYFFIQSRLLALQLRSLLSFDQFKRVRVTTMSVKPVIREVAPGVTIFSVYVIDLLICFDEQV